MAAPLCSLGYGMKDFHPVESMGPYYYKGDPIKKPPFPPEVSLQNTGMICVFYRFVMSRY